MPRIKRTIHFHEINGTASETNHLGFIQSTISLFENLRQSYVTRNENRFFHFDAGRTYMVSDILFSDENRRVRGKILTIRSDVFPQLMEDNDNLVDIDANQYVGVVETTHFFCSIKRNKINLAIEFNQEGAKESDFITILRQTGERSGLFRNIDWIPLTNNTLEEIEQRAGRISEFTMKIHRTNMQQLEQDLNIIEIFGNPQAVFHSQYATYDLKFDYRRENPTAIREFVMRVRNLFARRPQKMTLFNTFRIKAQDAEKNNRLSPFDLLAELLKVETQVERHDTSKVIISTSMYTELHTALYNLELL